MKIFVLLFLMLTMLGCATAQHYSALQVVRRIDPGLAEELTVAGFEHRLASLNASIEGDSAPGAARVATFNLPAGAGGLAARSVYIVYTHTDDGYVRVESAKVLSLMIVNHAKA